MTAIDTFLQECNAVSAGHIKEITGLRARAKSTGLALKSMRLVAMAADVEIVADGKELKVVR